MRVPCSTYRLQFNSGFEFWKANRVIEYLSQLGITDIYASPIFAARKGSTHGYDVVDATVLNPEIGNESDFSALIREVKSHDMGWLQDIVPNHMAFDGQNRLLMDVLEHGHASEYFTFFDIDWDHADQNMKGRLLAPFLGRSYGESLAESEIKVRFGAEGFTFHYFDLKLSLNIESYATVLGLHVDNLKERLGENHSDWIKFVGVLNMVRGIHGQLFGDERYEQVRFAKRMLWELYRGNQDMRWFIDGNLDEINRGGEFGDHNLLNDLHSAQFFRLSFWKVANEEINYRRFFNINDLISLRMEDSKVYDHSHRLVLRLIGEGIFTGLRIDHIDGLYDPLSYLRNLQETSGGIYVNVEKILANDEIIPSHWPVQGSTGYDFLNSANGIFCRQESEAEFDRIYSFFTGTNIDFMGLVYEKKQIIIERFMTGDVDNLAHLLKRISSKDRQGADITIYGIKRAIHEVLAFFPVYRTYVGREGLAQSDQRYITEAIDKAKERNPDLLYELNYLNKFLSLHVDDYLGEDEKRERLHFVMRFQQLTGPLMAKGFEDTALYVYNRLISLNEVGGNPHSFGIPLIKFHVFNSNRARNCPHTMNATSTHDTKRGEDVRARINVLSELPMEWNTRVRTWKKMNRRYRKKVNAARAPSRNDEYFLYQTLVGALPFRQEEYSTFVTRIKEYMIKAIREAKIHTSWLKADMDYEQACTGFIHKILMKSEENKFLKDFVPFQAKIAHFGILNSLSQTLLKITSPGFPDFYQGSELWELTLVDPDNRSPVDFEYRAALLLELQQSPETDAFFKDLLAAPQDGKIKLYLIYRALHARKENPHVFQNGVYVPLRIDGSFKDHVIAFARNSGSTWFVTVAPRFCTALVEEGQYPLGNSVWQDTKALLPENAPSQWHDSITGHDIDSREGIPIGNALSDFPVALLGGQDQV